jgi:hypothetical protein
MNSRTCKEVQTGRVFHTARDRSLLGIVLSGGGRRDAPDLLVRAGITRYEYHWMSGRLEISCRTPHSVQLDVLDRFYPSPVLDRDTVHTCSRGYLASRRLGMSATCSSSRSRRSPTAFGLL